MVNFLFGVMFDIVEIEGMEGFALVSQLDDHIEVVYYCVTPEGTKVTKLDVPLIRPGAPLD